MEANAEQGAAYPEEDCKSSVATVATEFTQVLLKGLPDNVRNRLYVHRFGGGGFWLSVRDLDLDLDLGSRAPVSGSTDFRGTQASSVVVCCWPKPLRRCAGQSTLEEGVLSPGPRTSRLSKLVPWVPEGEPSSTDPSLILSFCQFEAKIFGLLHSESCLLPRKEELILMHPQHQSLSLGHWGRVRPRPNQLAPPCRSLRIADPEKGEALLFCYTKNTIH